VKTPLNAATALILALLQGPGYGLDLIERARARSRGRILLRQGSAYPALREFERQGLLRSWTVSRPGAGRPRTYYELTQQGIIEAQTQLETIAGFAATEAGPVPSDRELDAMRAHMEQCFGVTEFAMMLSRAGEVAGL